MSTDKNKVIVSVIIPTYNETETISDCLGSLIKQTHQNMEIIIVDDESSDNTRSKVVDFVHKSKSQNIFLIQQEHNGPGEARNLGVKHSRGAILVFVDADMTFDKDYIKRLVDPIISGQTIGTFSQDENLANPQNYWARCWNMGRFAAAGVYTNDYLRSIIPDTTNKGGIFRAILKSKFEAVGGFERTGDYTDDKSLVERLGVKATLTKGAIFYHKNPSNIFEVWSRASWIGSGKNFTKNNTVKILNLIRFSLLASFIKGTLVSIKFGYPLFIPFKVIYDLAVWVSVLNSL